MNRRELLASAAGSAVVAAFAGCAARQPRQSGSALYRGERRFARVQVSPARIIRTVAGLRPFRPSGFVVKAEKFDSKIVVHNYGHGGGGMSLSWGTSQMAVEEAVKTSQTRYAVLGSGGVGLATARLLQRRGFDVTIYAKDLPPHTTSNISGALWDPVEVSDPDKTTPEYREQFARAARLSHRYFQDLVGDYYGVRWIENYVLSDDPPHNPSNTGSQNPIRDLYPDMRTLSAGEHPFAAPYVRRYSSMLIEPPIYLNAVTRDFLLAGGRIVIREFDSLQAVLALQEQVILNCTGLGAGGIFHDEELMPIKGQLSILLPQTEVDYITLTDEHYMFPRKDGILLGGTHERGVWTLEPDPAAAERIIAAHAKIFSAMRV
jgi:glycine/D-amino acid oxidase-like deaminating enzyme